MNERDTLLREIENMEIQLNQAWLHRDKMKSADKDAVAKEIEEKEIKSLDLKIAKKYEDYAESLNRDYGQKVYSIGEIYEMDLPGQEWIIDSLVPDKSLTAISGAPGSYKSWLSLYLAKCILEGKMVFDRYNTVYGNVLIIDLENNMGLIKDRCKMLSFGGESNLYYWQGEFNIEKDLERLELLLKEKSIRVLIIDSLVRIHNSDENDARAMSQVLKKLRSLANLGVAVIFVHHSRKQSFFGKSNAGESMRGSSDILAAIDSHLLLEKTSGGVKLSQPKLRAQESIKTLQLRIISEGDKFDFEFVGEVEETVNKITEARNAILGLLENNEKPRQEIIETLKGLCGSVTLDKALKGMLAENILSRKVGKDGTHIYFIVAENPESQEEMGFMD